MTPQERIRYKRFLRLLWILVLPCLFSLGCSGYVPARGDEVEVVSGFYKGFKGKVTDENFLGNKYLVYSFKEGFEWFFPRELKKVEIAE